MDFLDYYALLGLPQSAGVADIRQAYRNAASIYHPDVNKSPGASALFRHINTANETLGKPLLRREYDQLWSDITAIPPRLDIDVLYSRQYMRPLPEPQLLYLLLNIKPMESLSLTTDSPINICLVVDRSTSMHGERLNHVKTALHHLIDNCNDTDIISVVAFSDHAEVLIPSQHPEDKRGMRAMVSAMRANGATAIYEGLQAGLSEIRKNLKSQYVNHIVLITDGRTYGDEEECFRLAANAHEEGVGISGMGIGEDWNDRFLDELAKKTGGASTYISSSRAVAAFLDSRVRTLASAYAEHVDMILAPTPYITVQSVTRVTPSPMVLNTDIQPIPLGGLDGKVGIKALVQLHVTTGEHANDDLPIGCVLSSGKLLGAGYRKERLIKPIAVRVVEDLPDETPPPELLDALSKVTLYQLQDRARQALEDGDVEKATQHLEHLATRLFESGQEGLGQTAIYESQQISKTRQLSDAGEKLLNYGTRALILSLGEQDHD